MNDQIISQIVNKYVKEHLSPKSEQRAYITEKYEELCGFLSNNCFQSGSYARYTANAPVHDLDVIHPVPDVTILDNPSIVIDSLYALLEEGYSQSQITRIKRIYTQSHSVTVEFADSQEEFSMDVVPAIELSTELNDYDQPFYLVPEILRLNKHNRQLRYDTAEDSPIEWIKSDPRGYIQATSNLNGSNSDFRHTAKLLKSWRHACKMEYGDNFCLKSFHLEQVIYNYFISNPGTSTLIAVIDCLAMLPECLTQPQFTDRADPDKYIDEYVNALTLEQKRLILRLQADAYVIVRKLPGSESEQEVIDHLEQLLTVQKQSTPSFIPPTQVVTPHQPWSY